MIHLENLHFAYGPNPVLRDITMTISQGEIVSILGPNGCGKSTLLKLLRGVLKPQQGTVSWQGQPPHAIKRREMARRCAVVSQSEQPLFGYTVEEMVSMARFARLGLTGTMGASDQQAIEEALQATDIVHLRHKSIMRISGGERQRVYLARALAQQATVLLLDEATSSLDLDHRWDTARLLQHMNRQQSTTIVQVSHDLDLAAATSHRIILLNATGQIVASGTPTQVYTPEHLASALRVHVAVDINPHSGTPRVTPLGSLRSHGSS